jgi:sugar-specific transcriptional regulator TrmB
MVNRTDILKQLQLLGLSTVEATLYGQLLRAPLSRLELSRITGINRTKVYRVIDELIARGIVEERSDQSGTKLAATPVDSFERIIKEEEGRLEARRAALKELQEFVIDPQPVGKVGVRIYKGREGLRQQLWNELRGNPREILILSKGDSLNEPFGRLFSERFRAELVRRGIKQRALQNEPDCPGEFGREYLEHFKVQTLSREQLNISREMTVLKDRINIYSWSDDTYFGVEIVDRIVAGMFKQIFEGYWEKRDRKYSGRTEMGRQRVRMNKKGKK